MFAIWAEALSCRRSRTRWAKPRHWAGADAQAKTIARIRAEFIGESSADSASTIGRKIICNERLVCPAHAHAGTAQAPDPLAAIGGRRVFKQAGGGGDAFGNRLIANRYFQSISLA